LLHRAKLDGNAPLRSFCLDLEAACIEVIDVDGVMTKDLALAIHGKNMKREHWAITDAYLDAVKVRFGPSLFFFWLLLSYFAVDVILIDSILSVTPFITFFFLPLFNRTGQAPEETRRTNETMKAFT